MSQPQVFHPVQNTAEVKFIGDRAGDPRITTLHYRYGPIGGPRPTTEELQDLAHAVRVGVLPFIVQCVTPGTRWTKTTARDIHDANGAYAEEVLNPIVVGGRANQGALPGNVQIHLAKKSSDPRKRGRGGMFLMDLAKVDIEDSNVLSSLQPLLIDLGVQLMLNRGALRNFVAVVASKKFGTFAPIVGILFDLVSDSMRTRLKNHRRVKRRPA